MDSSPAFWLKVIVLGLTTLGAGIYLAIYLLQQHELKLKGPPEQKETFKIIRRIPADESSIKIDIGNRGGIEIIGPDHVPIIVDGRPKQKYKKGFPLFGIDAPRGKGDGILYAWIEDQQLKLSLAIYDEILPEQRKLIARVIGNEFEVFTSDTIDYNYNLEIGEVIKKEGDKVTVMLRIELLPESVLLSFQTALESGRSLFIGNNQIRVITTQSSMRLENDVVPKFKYPGKQNRGRLADIE